MMTETIINYSARQAVSTQKRGRSLPPHPPHHQVTVFGSEVTLANSSSHWQHWMFLCLHRQDTLNSGKLMDDILRSVKTLGCFQEWMPRSRASQLWGSWAEKQLGCKGRSQLAQPHVTEVTIKLTTRKEQVVFSGGKSRTANQVLKRLYIEG